MVPLGSGVCKDFYARQPIYGFNGSTVNYTICLSKKPLPLPPMNDLYKKRRLAKLFTSAVAIASMMWIGIEPPLQQQQAVAQSPMDMMDMMMGRGGNMTDSASMMLGNNNMSMPFNMGVLAMPMMCTTPNQLLGSLTGMFGSGMMAGNDGNATQQMMMGLMRQQMMSQVGGMGGMTDSEMQQVMNLVICIPMMEEEMMQGMMGMENNTMGSMMDGMMMQ